MTEEQFSCYSVPEKLLALTSSYFINIQLQQSMMTKATSKQSEVSDYVYDLSLLFREATEESLHLDILFAWPSAMIRIYDD